MDRTEATIRNLLAALPAPGYDLGILSERGMYRLETVSHDRFVRLIPYLKYRNANDAHVYLRPTGESAYTLLDDLTESTLRTLTDAGYGPAAVIETSHGSFQAWLRHEQPLYKELGTLAAKSLAARFGADSSAADWRRFGRAPAFTNRKPKYRNASGLFPFARLIGHTGEIFSAASDFRIQLRDLQRQMELDSAQRRRAFVHRSTPSDRPVSLLRFRESARYRGRPAAADMAFCIAAFSQGMPENEMAAALTREYLSRDRNQTRQAAYVRRTMAKAFRWVA